jgi:hypothetical protein
MEYFGEVYVCLMTCSNKGEVLHIILKLADKEKKVRTFILSIHTPLQNIPLIRPEALKSLYRSPGYKKNQLVLCKNYVQQW